VRVLVFNSDRQRERRWGTEVQFPDGDGCRSGSGCRGAPGAPRAFSSRTATMAARAFSPRWRHRVVTRIQFLCGNGCRTRVHGRCRERELMKQPTSNAVEMKPVERNKQAAHQNRAECETLDAVACGEDVLYLGR
jgi:hypothetical protein